MSTFEGQMREYRNCSIDRFDGENLRSTAYFLSHCHKDHMVGLDNNQLLYRLQSNSSYKLYCSDVTKNLLIRNPAYAQLQKHIVSLDVSSAAGHITHTLAIPDATSGKIDYEVNVTLLQAGHCPGSVMFLFEGADGRVLYTGDFRLSKSDLMGMEALHNGSNPKPIKSMYLDTTFLSPSAVFIPSREESAEVATSLAGDWLRQGDHHHVMISHRASLGYEQLYKEMAVSLKMKVHVPRLKYEEYKTMGDMKEYTTPDASDTRLHACRCKDFKMADNGLPIELRTIKVSTMAFVQTVGMEHIMKRFSEKFIRVCYSFHSSYSEIREMLMYLHPSNAYPNVIPIGETKKQIFERLNKIIEYRQQIVVPNASQRSCDLGKLVRRRKRKYTQNTPDSDLDFGDSQSPQKRLKTSQVHSKGSSGNSKDISSNADGMLRFSCVEDDCVDTSVEDKETVDLTVSSESDSTLSEMEDCNTDSIHRLEELSAEDQVLLDSFTPVNGGSLGQYVSYCSDIESEDESNNKENKITCQKIWEKRSKSIISNGIGCSDLITISDDSQSLNLYLDGASDDSESKTENPIKEGGGDSSKSKEENVNKEDKVKVKNGDIGSGEGIDNDNVEEKKNVSDEKSGIDLEPQKDCANANIEPCDIDDMNNDKSQSENDKIDSVGDDSNLIELISDKKEDESISEILELSVDQSKGKRKREDTDETEKLEENEPPVKKGPKTNEKSPKSNIVASSSKGSAKEIDGMEEEDEDVILVDSDENSKDNSNSVDYNYLTKQQYMVQCLMAQEMKKQAMVAMKPKGDSGGPIDLTGEEESGEDSFVDSDVEELDSSELDTEAEAELHDYDSDSSRNSVDEREWKIAYDQLRKLRRQGQSKDPPPSEGVIILDSSDEDDEKESKKTETKQEKTETTGKNKEMDEKDNVKSPPEQLENENDKNEQQSSKGLEASGIDETNIEKGDNKETSDRCEEKSSAASCENYSKASVENDTAHNDNDNKTCDMGKEVDNHVTNDELNANDSKEKETDHVTDSVEQKDVEKNNQDGIVEPEEKKNTEGNGADDSVMKSMEENSPTIDKNSGNEDQPQESEMSEEL